MTAERPYYPILEAKIAENGYLKKDIAKELGITPRSFISKLSGDVDFWWKEVEYMCSLFPDVSPFELLKHDENEG